MRKYVSVLDFENAILADNILITKNVMVKYNWANIEKKQA